MHYSRTMWKLIHLAYIRKSCYLYKKMVLCDELSTTIPRIFRTWAVVLFRNKTLEKRRKRRGIWNKLCGYPIYRFFPYNTRFHPLKKKIYLVRNKTSLWESVVSIMKVSPLRKKKKKGGKKKKIMGQSSGVLTIKAGLGIPWKHNYFEKNKYLYAGDYYLHRFLERFFGFLFKRGLTYRIDFLKFYNLQDFLSIYYKSCKVRQGRRAFAKWPIPGFLISQVFVNYVWGWAIISLTTYRVELKFYRKSLLGHLIQLRCFYDAATIVGFDF